MACSLCKPSPVQCLSSHRYQNLLSAQLASAQLALGYELSTAYQIDPVEVAGQPFFALTCMHALAPGFMKDVRQFEDVRKFMMLRLLLRMSRTNAREELRLQAGTLRFDLNTLIAQKDKISRKAAEALKKDFLLKVHPHSCFLHALKAANDHSCRSLPAN